MKKHFTYKYAAMALFAFSALTSRAQSADIGENYWTPSSLQALQSSNSATPQINAHKADYYQLEFANFNSELSNSNDGSVIYLPLINGEFQAFTLSENTTMSEGLRENYPQINSFNIISTESRNVWGKIDISHNGFRAMIFQPGKSTLFIDPVFHNLTEAYMVYRKADFYTDKTANCQVDSRDGEADLSIESSRADYTDCVLNTYRVAVAATGEYTAYHGGDLEDALAAQVTTMNRVNMVYERDFGVTLTLIPNNDEIVYTNAGSDPYSNGNAGAMINENQANINSVIGSSNYDLGHVFGTNSGGLAGLGVTCSNNSKARGVTGSSNPVNDPFDIDYVAHEMGHQFGGNHSFNNSCNGNRNGNTAMEPGSGSTIMAYAGICAPNVQSNSDDHFHGVNMREIGLQINSDNCQEVTDLGNTSPALESLELEIYIPINTPFMLTAEASDVDGDELTYCWEQMDNEISTQSPVASSEVGPNFRSNSPLLSPTRHFPTLSSLVNGGPFTWEVLPSVEREMNFRVTVRDNAPVAGCTQYDDLTVVSIADAGPFEVIYPSANGITWQALDNETITWDVANTTAAPISADLVDIFLSLDGGVTFDIQLADDTENDGEYAIQVPNVSSTDAYVMVVNSAGTFFDISDNDFTINSIENGFVFDTDFTGATVCQGEQIQFDVEFVEVGSFNESISLSAAEIPLNASVNLNPISVNVGDMTSVTINGMDDTPAGVYNFTLAGDAASFDNQITFEIIVLDASPEATTLLLPANNADGIGSVANLSWNDNATIGMNYTLELATDAGFSNVVLTETGLSDDNFTLTDLDSETTYYWRVSNVNDCATSAPSEVFQFTTYTCAMEINGDGPIAIPSDPAEISSEIDITSSGSIADVKVIDITGTHSMMPDLTFTLVSPSGTEAELLSGNCGLSMTLAANGDIDVSTPSDIAGEYESSGAADFGGNIPGAGITGRLVQALDASADPEGLCDPAINGALISGNIALVNRGGCPFVDKVLNAQNAGAIAVIVANNAPGDGYFDMGGTSTEINIPAIMVSYEDGQILASGLAGDSEGFSFSFDDNAPAGNVPCPSTDGGTYQSAEPLSIFQGEEASGTWTLKLNDSQSENGGSLTSWVLEVCLSGETPDGTNDLDKIEASIFPNPTRDMLTVQLNNGVASQITLLDIAGRIIETQNPNDSTIQFNMSALANGVYIVKVEGDNFAQTVYKVVKN